MATLNFTCVWGVTLIMVHSTVSSTSWFKQTLIYDKVDFKADIYFINKQMTFQTQHVLPISNIPFF